MSNDDLTGAIDRAAVGDIEHAADGSFRRRYVFGTDFPGFSGHFPARPILPAVLQIMTVSLLVEAATGQRLQPCAIAQAKFVKPVPPGALVEITCRKLPGAADVWEARLVSDRRETASFFLTLRPTAGAA